MKTIKLILVIMAFSTINFFGISQESNETEVNKVKKIEILTSAQCSDCKVRIEKNMAYEKGVKSVNLNLETKVVTIEYKVDKTNPDKLREAISKIGYDADDVPADQKAYNKLPACCQKGGHDHE